MRYTICSTLNQELELENLLQEKGHIRDDEKPEFIFSVGGDGTILRTIHKYIKIIDHVYIIGINFGKLGFYTDFNESDIPNLMDLIEKNNFKCHEYHLLEYLLKNRHAYKKGYGLNEVAIINPIHTQIIDVYIDNLHFETFRGTGLIISTPTGSTAYNKSLGGSVIDPRIKAMQLTEIAPINNRVYKALSSPVVLSNKSIIKLKSDFANASFTFDGIYEDFKDVEEAIIRLSSIKVKFISGNKTNFWDRVKNSFLE